MRTLWIAALLFTGCVLRLNAQEVVYSPYQKFDNHNGDYGVIGKVNSKLFTYRSDGHDYFLDVWNDSMDRAATVVLDFFPEKIYDLRFVSYPDKIVALYQGLERNHVTQYAAMLNEKGLLQGRPVVVADEKTSIFGASGTYFKTAVSENEGYLMVYNSDSKRDGLSLDYTLLNDSLRKVSHGMARFAADESLTAGDVLLSNNGNAFLAAYAAAGPRDYAAHMWMLSLKPGGNRLEDAPLPLGGRYGASLFMRLDGPNEKIYIAGFYSDRKNGNHEGVLYTTYATASAGFDSVRLLPLTEQLKIATGARRTGSAFNDFDVKQLIVKNNGGFVLIAENSFVTTRNTGAPFGYYSYYNSPFGPGTTIREYHYNDILALAYTPDGALEWNNFIRKDQYSQEDGGRFSSYAFLNSGGSLAFLYNDFGRSSKIQLATIDGAGKSDIHSLSTADDDPDWVPREARQTAKRELIVPCLRKRQLCFARVVL